MKKIIVTLIFTLIYILSYSQEIVHLTSSKYQVVNTITMRQGKSFPWIKAKTKFIVTDDYIQVGDIAYVIKDMKVSPTGDNSITYTTSAPGTIKNTLINITAQKDKSFHIYITGGPLPDNIMYLYITDPQDIQ